MNKEELESKFDDCFDANTRASEGGYGADTTDRQKLWEHFYPIVQEHAKQQAIEFMRDCLEKGYLKPDEDGTVRLDYNYWHESAFTKAAEDLCNQFIEQQNKP